MARKLPEKRPRADDLPPFDTETARLRMLDALWNGPPTAFVEAVFALGLDAEPVQLVRSAFSAYERAAIEERRTDDFRPKAMGEVLPDAELVEQAFAAIERLCSTRALAEIGPGRIEDFMRQYGPDVPVPGFRDLIDIREKLGIMRDFLAATRNTLTSRGASRSRLRLFANELAPQFFEMRPSGAGAGPAFEKYLVSCVELLTGASLSGGLIWSVPREIAARR